jgi:integrase/recombinase XerD
MKYSKYLDGYEAYLRAKFRDEKNPTKHRRILEKYLDWVDENDFTQIKYSEMMEYIRYLRDSQMQAKHINNYLRAVRHFFDYLQEAKSPFLNPIINYNPALGVQIRDVFHSIRADYLNQEELEKLIEEYQGNHRIMLGLLVYQGLKINEIEKLEKIHFDLKKGTVYVPKSIRGNSRILKLDANQVYELMEHLLGLKTDRILGFPLHNQGRKLCKDLRKINPKVRNPHHLRGSRISYWVRNYDLREAQYLAGHNTIAGIEEYRKVNVEDLANEVNKYHPLG